MEQRIEIDALAFEYASWWRSDGQTLGKRFDLDEIGNVVDELGAVFADRVQRRQIRSLHELKAHVESLRPGQEFVTSGLPPKGLSEVTVKDDPKPGYTTRTAEDVHWEAGLGGLFVVDFDSKWCPWYSDDEVAEPLDELHERLTRAAQHGGLDLSNTQSLT